MKLNKIAKLVLFLGIICIIIFPYLFTRTGTISFIGTGEIGDTIGGITAPITGLIGAILIYLALRAQIDANNLISIQLKKQKEEDDERRNYRYISDLYKYLNRLIDNVEYNKHRGEIAIKRMLETFADSTPSQAHDYQKILTYYTPALFPIYRLILIFTKKLACSKINNDDKLFFKDLIQFHLDEIIFPSMNKEMSIPLSCDICEINHNGFPINLKNTILDIQKSLNSISKN